MAKVGKILIAVAAVAAVVALNYYAPGIANALGVNQFLVTIIGSVVISVGFNLLSGALFKPRAAAIEGSKVNVRIGEPPRYINGGIALQGGAALFGEFDSLGNFWYIIVHCDSILAQTIQYYLDDKLVTLDAQGNVTDNDFCLNSKFEPYTGSGTKVPYFQLFTRTYSETNAAPPPVAELQAAFPDMWTTIDHLLVGTTYTVVRCKAIKIADRYKVYRWRGAFGLGEPSVSIAGSWSNMYDPRDPSQILGNRATYKTSSNSAIVHAWFRTHPFGRNKPESSIDWEKVAEQADICDQQITGIEGTQPRYQCGTAVIDNKERSVAESEIMQSCDGQIVFNDEGKSWLRVGYYTAPTLRLTRNRDIIAMESVEAQDGESETQGVIVQYLDPATGYSLQSSAPWYNPNYYKAGEGNTFLTIRIETCQNHNQAMRLAKSIGLRSQPLHKIGPTVGLRGLKALSERFVEIQYDNIFSGDYEVCTPIEVDESGMFCSLGLVPIDINRFSLLQGEEKPKPVYANVDTISNPAAPISANVQRKNGRIEATFNAPANAGLSYQFQYILSSDTSGNWADMTVDMPSLFAYSAPIDEREYQVRYRSVTPGGIPSDYHPPVNVPAESIAVPDPGNADTPDGSYISG